MAIQIFDWKGVLVFVACLVVGVVAGGLIAGLVKNDWGSAGYWIGGGVIGGIVGAVIALLMGLGSYRRG